jgi:hypothetical protein
LTSASRRDRWPSWGRAISRINGFYLFNTGVQVFRVGEEGLGPDMLHWNTDTPWKDTYNGLAGWRPTEADEVSRCPAGLTAGAPSCWTAGA